MVVTGGTGALGTAVVGALLEAGATCHVTWIVDEEVHVFPYRNQVHLTRVDCTSPEQVQEFFGTLEAICAML